MSKTPLTSATVLKKTVAGAFVAAAAVAALSACNPNVSTNAAGQNNVSAASAAGGKPKVHAAPKFTVAQENAIESARSYLSMGSGFSRAGLIEQLSSKAGEGFKKSDAVFAVNHVRVNWKQQAVLSAKSYLSMGSGFSRTSLIEQLSSQAGEQFTVAQATYAANKVGL
jgi:hypothetical protein